MSAGFASIKELVDAENDGQASLYSWRKVPSQVTTQGVWFDMSVAAGNPAPQFYLGATGTATQLKLSTDGGLYHRRDVTPLKKYLRQTIALTTTATALPMTMMLCDYLLFYPFIDESVLEEQLLDNTITLSRSTDGVGVQIMAVSIFPRTGGQTFIVSYTNSDGVAGRVTTAVIQSAATATGTILSSAVATNGAAGPFLPLQGNDKGVRSIESITMLGADVGSFALCLVKPLGQTQLRGIDAPVEVDYYLSAGGLVPRIEDDAYLNWICLPNGSLSGTNINGTIKTVWN